ncbi:TIM-barrel domain-containing protein [Algoriphagus sp. NG3]|uniref:TIM-barrel domain-containing protein n=1 Tax=unclassified Algoriphagus TaxID=2641541 RepID=UPI002A7F19C0|nr:TIM-barrel domain-containing protein [Algoriphagus sp. NG3]WPR76057.1 glycoside hydrolase family 31 protein [Algoriphagus sp. NG3]
MKRLYFKYTWVAFSILLLFSSCTTSRSQEIGKEIMIFYPENFVPERMLPSMMLLEEPKEQGAVPTNWRIVPEFSEKDGKNITRIAIEDGTDLYGTGEVLGGLSNNGKTVQLWNTDNYAYKREDGRQLYQSHPWVMAVRKDGSAYGILIDNTWKQKITLTNPIVIESDGPASRIIVIERESPQELVMTLAELTGTMEMPPLWALGFQQSRYSYTPDSRVKEIASEFRKRKLPIDVIWMDINYMQNYKVFTFDSLAFPNPAEVNDFLHAHDFKSVWMIDPGIKKEPGYFVYDQGTAGDHWIKTSRGTEYNGEVWPGICAFPDFTRPATRTWWSGLYTDFMATGIDGVWNDMNEPAVFNTPEATMPEDNLHSGGDELPADIHRRYHNVYGMLMVKASRDGILAANPDKRPFVLSRANFMGGQRYAATWTGDNSSTWEHFKMATPMVLNLGLSGQPFSGPDLGGYSGSPDEELLAHWTTVGVFYPFSRNHTEANTNDQEPWALGKKVEDISRVALERRYRLMPYLYSLFYEASQTGLPIMRPVYFADVKDTTLRKEDEAFLWGDDLLIVPKWSKNPSLPKGSWRSVSVVGEDSENDPYQPDIKLRGGAIVPMGQIIQSTVEYKLDSVTLMVSLDENMQANGDLYSDEGDGFGYKDGKFTMIEFDASVTGQNTLKISVAKSDGDLPVADRYYRIALVGEEGMRYSDWIYGKNLEIPLGNLKKE